MVQEAQLILVKCHSTESYSTVQVVLQIIPLCFLLMFVGSSQVAANPHTHDIVYMWFVNYHIRNLHVRGHAFWYHH